MESVIECCPPGCLLSSGRTSYSTKPVTPHHQCLNGEGDVAEVRRKDKTGQPSPFMVLHVHINHKAYWGREVGMQPSCPLSVPSSDIQEANSFQ